MIDLPFGSEDTLAYEPSCPTCEDSGMVEYGDRILPCSACRGPEYDYAIDVGSVEP